MSSDIADNIESISAEIGKLQARLKKVVAEKRAAALQDVKKQIALFDFSATELGLSTKQTTKHKPVAAKYQDPKDHKNTWSGRGPAPLWVAASGLPLEKLLIKK